MSSCLDEEEQIRVSVASIHGFSFEGNIGKSSSFEGRANRRTAFLMSKRQRLLCLHVCIRNNRVVSVLLVSMVVVGREILVNPKVGPMVGLRRSVEEATVKFLFPLLVFCWIEAKVPLLGTRI